MADNSTLISDCYEPVRWMLGDNGSDATLFTYPDDSIAGAIRTAIRMGKLRCFTLTPDRTAITPAITNPNQLALLIYHTVKMFIDPQPSDYRFATRASKESIGHWRTFINTLESEIYHLESGTQFDAWINYYTWLAGMSGLPLAMVMTQLNLSASVFGVDFSLDARPLPVDEVVKY